MTSGQTPPPRCGHTGTLVNKLLFVVGGAADAAAVPALAATGAGVSSSGEFTDVHVLDTESWSWWRPDVGPSPLPPIAYHSACLIADKIFLFGGSTRDAIYNDVLMLETSTSHWQVVEAGGGGGGGGGAPRCRGGGGSARRAGAGRGCCSSAGGTGRTRAPTSSRLTRRAGSASTAPRRQRRRRSRRRRSRRNTAVGS